MLASVFGERLTDVPGSHTSPRRKPGDCGHETRPACHANPVSPNHPASPDFRPGLCGKCARAESRQVTVGTMPLFA